MSLVRSSRRWPSSRGIIGRSSAFASWSPSGCWCRCSSRSPSPPCCAALTLVEKQHGRSTAPFDRPSRPRRPLPAPAGGALAHRLWVVLATVAVASSGFFLPTSARPSPRRRRGRFWFAAHPLAPASITPTPSCARSGGPRHPPGGPLRVLADRPPPPGRSTRARWWCAWCRAASARITQQDVIPMLREDFFAQIAGARVFAAPYPMVRAPAASRCSSCSPAPTCRNSAASRPGLQRKLARQPGIRPHRHRPAARPAPAHLQPDRLRIADAGLRHPGRGPGHQHAHRRRRHRQVQRRARRRPALRHPRQGGGQLHPASRSFQDLPAQQGRRDGAPRQRGQLPRSPRPGGGRALRPAVRHHLLRHPHPALAEAVEAGQGQPPPRCCPPATRCA